MAASAVACRVAEFRLQFAGPGGVRLEEPLERCWSTSFEAVAPVRAFSAFKGQHNFTGLYWMACLERHVGYESWLERDHLMLLDFDPTVVAAASQPFWLFWQDEQGGPRRHAPDFFVRLADGTGVVVDVRADDRIEARDAEAFAAMERACTQVGWLFRRVGTPAAVFMANVRWLAGYRHRRCRRSDELVRRLVEAFAEPAPLFAGADRAGPRVVVLPVVYHLLWHGALTADLRSDLLGPDTMVSAGGRA